MDNNHSTPGNPRTQGRVGGDEENERTTSQNSTTPRTSYTTNAKVKHNQSTCTGARTRLYGIPQAKKEPPSPKQPSTC